MGYTHYWYRTTAAEPKEAFGHFALDAVKIVFEATEAKIDVAGPDGTGAPVLAEGLISLNGREGRTSFGTLEAFAGQLDETDGSHETFYWPAINEEGLRTAGRSFGKEGEQFYFCKTARKPYDAVVCALLIAAKDAYGDSIRVSSDGSWGGVPDVTWGAEWRAGRELYMKALGQEATNPMGDDDGR